VAILRSRLLTTDYGEELQNLLSEPLDRPTTVPTLVQSLSGWISHRQLGSIRPSVAYDPVKNEHANRKATVIPYPLHSLKRAKTLSTQKTWRKPNASSTPCPGLSYIFCVPCPTSPKLLLHWIPAAAAELVTSPNKKQKRELTDEWEYSAAPEKRELSAKFRF
jgi:hypothetical protein